METDPRHWSVCQCTAPPLSAPQVNSTSLCTTTGIPTSLSMNRLCGNFTVFSSWKVAHEAQMERLPLGQAPKIRNRLEAGTPTGNWERSTWELLAILQVLQASHVDLDTNNGVHFRHYAQHMGIHDLRHMADDSQPNFMRSFTEPPKERSHQCSLQHTGLNGPRLRFVSG